MLHQRHSQLYDSTEQHVAGCLESTGTDAAGVQALCRVQHREPRSWIAYELSSGCDPTYPQNTGR